MTLHYQEKVGFCQTLRNSMVIYDLWHPDDGYSVQGEELDSDVNDWPTPSSDKSLTLRLEELTHFDISTRIEARSRNLLRLQKAKSRNDINHLEVHYSCLADQKHRIAVEELLNCDKRKWVSFTMHGINGIADLYSRPVPLEDLSSLFVALRSVQVLNLFSLPWLRGHGLDAILKTIPLYTNLKELRLQGWQMDQVSITALVEALQDINSSDKVSLTLLSLRSCTFLGERSFHEVVDLLATAKHLQTLNIGYCNLQDAHIVYLIQKMRKHQSIQCLHIGGNDCLSPTSVQVIADWLASETCSLRDLNLRALWAAYSEEGLLQRPVDLSVLFDAVRRNFTLERLILSENYLEDDDVRKLVDAILGRGSLTHLDLGDNPFTEEGASSLLMLARNCHSMDSIRFENVYVPYDCTDAIKAQTTINLFGNRLSKTSATVPLTLWPSIIPCLHSAGDQSYTNEASPDLIYHFLQTTTGEFGLPLSLQLVAKERTNII
jgi:Ran GTPase-activating protein (RanGAP) involved in mRNA processing and transport